MFQVEQASAFDRADERAIRLQIKRIISEEETEIILDLILSEPTLFTNGKTGRFNRSQSVIGSNQPAPEVKQDKITEIMVSYRDSLASLPKMDDLALDLKTVEAQKVANLPLLDTKQDQWKMIYRKMLEENKEDKDNMRFVLTLLRRDKNEEKLEDHNLKLTLFETSSGRQDVFVYTEKEILSDTQLADLTKGRSNVNVLFKKAIDSRLKIKKLQSSSVGVDSHKDAKIMAFFVNPALLEAPKGNSSMSRRSTSFNRGGRSGGLPVADKFTDEPADQLFAQIGNFDIRKGVCSNLLNPDPELNVVGTTAAQRSLVGQYDRDTLMFDVYQDLDPYEVKLRINAFDKENFRMLSSSNFGGAELKKYLHTDKKTHLMDGQQREELGKYLVENILIDESKNAMMLLKSQTGPAGAPPPV